MVKQKFDPKKWAIFGVQFGVVVGLLLTFFLTIITTFMGIIEGTPLGFIVGIGIGIMAIIFLAIFGAINWVVLGLFYHFVLKNFIERQTQLTQLIILTITWGIVMTILAGGSLVGTVVIGVVSALIIYALVVLAGLKLPFEEKKGKKKR